MTEMTPNKPSIKTIHKLIALLYINTSTKAYKVNITNLLKILLKVLRQKQASLNPSERFIFEYRSPPRDNVTEIVPNVPQTQFM